jgi:hypothetical protein
MHDVAKTEIGSLVPTVTSRFCTHCGQPVRLRLVGHVDDTGAAGDLQGWSCPWCDRLTEERLHGQLCSVVREFPSAR